MLKKETAPKGVLAFLYTSSIVVFLIGIALAIMNILNYIGTVKNYVSQGYEKAMVTKLLFPQAFPGVLEPVGVFFGIGVLLLAAALIIKKIWQALHVFYSGCEQCGADTEDIDLSVVGMTDASVELSGFDEEYDAGSDTDNEEAEILEEE